MSHSAVVNGAYNAVKAHFHLMSHKVISSFTAIPSTGSLAAVTGNREVQYDQRSFCADLFRKKYPTVSGTHAEENHPTAASMYDRHNEFSIHRINQACTQASLFCTQPTTRLIA